MTDLRAPLRTRIEDADARVVRIVASAGYGKTTIANALVSAGGGVLCDLADVDGLDELEVRIAEHLDEGSGDGDLLERWKRGGTASWFVLDGIDVPLDVPGGAALLRTLVRTLPPQRRLVLTARNPIPFDVTRGVAPHELLTLTEQDLAFDVETRRALIGATPVETEILERAIKLSRGWPIATLLFARLAREGTLTALIDRLDDDRFADLHAYLEAHILGEFDAATYRVVLACTAIPDATVDDVAEALGSDAAGVRAAVDETRVPITRRGDVCRVHPLVAAAMRRAAPERIRALQSEYAGALAERGRMLRAAELYLHAGDDHAAAAAFDAQGPRPAGQRTSPRAMRLLRRLSLSALIASRHAFDELLTCLRTRASPYELLEAVERYRETLDPGADPPASASARLAHGVLLRMAIRTREADALLAKAAADPDLPAERRRLLAANRAVVAAQLGRLSEARRIWTEAALDDDDGQTAFELERFELELFTALAGGEFDRIYQRHTALMRTLEREAVDPVIALMARMVDTLYRRLAGEIGNVAAFLRSIEAQSVARPELAHLLVPGEATNRGANVWSIVATLDMALYQTDVEVGRRLVALAIRGADMTGLPHFRVSSRVVAAFVPGNDAARLFAEALDAAREVDDPRLAASVEAISHGRVPEVGPFRTLLSKMEASPLIVAVSSLRVELLRGEVTRAGDAIPLRARDFELLAAIAFARGSLSRAALAQRLWPNAPDEEAPGLRMSIHRLRRQLREVDAVVTEDMAYRLGPGVVVDVDEIEMFLRAARRLTALTALTERDQARLGETFAALASPLPERYAQWEWFGIYEPRLAELRVEAGTLLGESLIRDGQFEAALAVAATLMQLDPADEPAAELVVRAHLGAGRRAEATRAFRRYRDLLAAEFGAAPSAELAALVGGPDGDAAVTPLVRARTAR